MSIFKDKKEYILKTKLDINECSRRLETSIDEKHLSLFSFSHYKGSREIIGIINGDKFRLQKRGGPVYLVDQLFNGQFNRQNDGTEIRGFFSMTPFGKAFTFSILGSIILFIILFLNSNKELFTKGGNYTGAISLLFFFLCGFLVFHIMVFILDQCLGRDRKEYIIDFLHETMEVEK